MEISVFCDGSYYSNLNCGIIAVVIKDSFEKTTIKELSEKIECKGSHESEYMALLKAFSVLNALQQVGQIPYQSKIKIMGDNRPLIETMQAKINSKNIKCHLPKAIYKEYKILESMNEIELKWIRRTRNKEADRATRIKNYMNKHQNTLHFD